MTASASVYSPQMAVLEKPGIADEADWITRAQSSDMQAFEALYRMHVDKIYGLCLRMTGNVAEAEDCAQEAFIQAWNKLDRFRGDSKFATWLHRIAVNAVLGRMRKSKREQDRIQVVTEQVSSPASVADEGELRRVQDMCSCCTRCMATVTTKQARCSALRRVPVRPSCTGPAVCWCNNWKTRDSKHE